MSEPFSCRQLPRRGYAASVRRSNSSKDGETERRGDGEGAVFALRRTTGSVPVPTVAASFFLFFFSFFYFSRLFPASV